MATTVRSFCKINLGLAIGPVRADGFHALTTCYQTLAAHDRVTVEARPAAETSLRITSNDERVPADTSNTAWKMVERALAALGVHAEVAIHIEKRLPVQGGIGAGSANAVAALIGLERELARAGVAALGEPERLRIAAEVGSDVPLFLVGGTVLGVGRGEEVSPLTDIPPTECVLALPEVGVSTPRAYRDWDALQGTGNRVQGTGSSERGAGGRHETAGNELTGSDGSDKLSVLSRALASAFGSGPPGGMSAGVGAHSSGVFAISEGLAGKTEQNPLLALVRTGIENDFEEVVFRQYPSLGNIKRILAGSGNPEEAAVYAALSGSGSALFGLYGTAEAAAAAEARLREAGIRTLRTVTLPREEYWRGMITKGD
ncbi:MAG: 4-(cytidine 5'-diphospho)-2-C-methyl-D-erythritol kinase [Acidobacteriaceae bacterium]